MNSLLVLVLVAAGEANHPATLGAASSARQLVGTDLQVDVRETQGAPTDEAAQAMGAALRAAAVVELVWESTEHRHVKLRFHLDRRPGWSERIIAFDEADDLRERGRTVGYAIASMMMGAEVEPPPRPAPVAPRPAPVAPRPAPPPLAAPTEPTTKSRTRGAIDALGAAAMGLGGPAGGWGGSLSGRWYVQPQFALRLGGSARSGEVAAAQSTSLFIHLAVGLAWTALPATRPRSFELAVRIDGLAMREQLAHFDADDTNSVIRMRWVPGVDAAVEGAWLFSPNAGFIGSFGPEVAFGQTDVTTKGERVATIPSVRVVLQLGVKATF